MNRAEILLDLLPMSEEEKPTPASIMRDKGLKYSKEVNNGVIIGKQITPLIYLKMTKRKHPVSSIRHKAINSIFHIHKGDASKMAHLYHFMYDQDEFDTGAIGLERANDIVYLGVFHTPEDAKKYLTGPQLTQDLGIVPGSRKVLSKQRKWTAKDLGLKDNKVE